MCNLTPWKAALVGPYVDFVGLGTIMPVLPFFLMDINADIFWLGFILSAQYFGVVVGSIFWGLVADYCGVRKVYLVLLFADTILFFMSGLCESVLTLVLVRCAAGFCAIMPLGTAWVSATAPPDKQMVAFTFLFI